MYLKRLYDEQLAQASYLVGCTHSGEALVVDPNRDVGAYMGAAEAEGLRITHVTETHIHADFVSGARELAATAGAQLLLSNMGGPDWLYEFARAEGAVLLEDGSSFAIGEVRVDAVHTPGHTPEHLCFVVTDAATSDRPVGAFTGDCIFAGDVGRPDLLERAAQAADTMESAARQLHHSLLRMATLPDYLQLWPGHGAGSACGKALGAMPQTTLGYEKLGNWAFAPRSEDEFVDAVLAGQPEPPRYFGEMKRINRVGPPALGGWRCPRRLDTRALDALLRDGAPVVDTRDAAAYASRHVPGTINIPLTRTFTTWAGWLLPYDADFYVIADEASALEASRDLSMIGLDRLAGYFDARVVEEWEALGRALQPVRQIDTPELRERVARGDVHVVDVRGQSEWRMGHVPGARNIPLGHLRERLGELPAGRPVVLQCQGGTRSAIAASVLLAGGVRDVVNYRGGFADWERNGGAVDRG